MVEDIEQRGVRMDQMNNRLQALELQQQRPAGNTGIQKEKYGKRGEPGAPPMSGERYYPA